MVEHIYVNNFKERRNILKQSTSDATEKIRVTKFTDCYIFLTKYIWITLHKNVPKDVLKLDICILEQQMEKRKWRGNKSILIYKHALYLL